MDAAKAKDEENRPHGTNNPSTIFSQLRSLSNTLFNSTASASPSSSSQSLVLESCNALSKPSSIIEEGLTPTPTRPSSPRRFPNVKNIFTNLASRSSRNTQPVRITVVQTQVQTEEGEGGNETPRYEPLTSPLGSEFTASSDHSHHLESSLYSPSQYPQISASGSFGSSELDDTPPLTPESLLTDIILLSPPSENVELGYEYGYDYEELHNEGAGQEDGYMPMQVDDPDEQYVYMRPHSMEIKEGKKPARPIDFDVLLADITNDADRPDVLLPSDDLNADENLGADDDKEEWYGLEYTLELSARERRASETHSFSVGEHSKSRESWAAIHQGTCHPFFEDEEYYQWKNWHRYLDRQDEKRKHRRGRAFKAHAKELAWFYADEMHTRDLMSWQMEVYGDIERNLHERLRVLEAHRPDPYYPPQKHDIGWYLKRSRSVASLRELRPLPEPMLQLQKTRGGKT
ncbi:hypothetical protein B0H19DRAFT_1168702 [Mycena capillaripes]|nr:hypothetical protein B0H19DRAFT_1168702 [Mycena capillaripes]